MKTAILFGATGLIGKNLLELLIKDNDYVKIKLFTRKSIDRKHPKLEIHNIDFNKLNDFANKIYLGKTTYEGLNAMHAQKASEDNPALKSLIDQGYTPSAYFSSYSNVASNLLGRPIDFMGADNKMFGALTDTMVGENNLGRPMTRGEFERYVRATPEWDTSENARDEAYGTVDTLLNSFGIRV